MLDHIGFDVKDFGKSKAFYEKALKPLEYKLTANYENAAGFGKGEKSSFWLVGGRGQTTKVHVAFSAPNRKAVDEYYKAAMAAGGKDNGKPGLRPDYHKDYYGAFVIDPDGNNVEAVCQTPER